MFGWETASSSARGIGKEHDPLIRGEHRAIRTPSRDRKIRYLIKLVPSVSVSRSTV